MHYSDRSWWAACGRAAKEKPVDRTSLKGGDSDAPAKREDDGAGRTSGWRGPPGQIGMRNSPETSRVGRRFIGTPAGLEKVSREGYCMAASSLIRWGGSAAVVGGLATSFVGGLLPPPIHERPRETV